MKKISKRLNELTLELSESGIRGAKAGAALRAFIDKVTRIKLRGSLRTSRLRKKRMKDMEILGVYIKSETHRWKSKQPNFQELEKPYFTIKENSWGGKWECQ